MAWRLLISFFFLIANPAFSLRPGQPAKHRWTSETNQPIRPVNVRRKSSTSLAFEVPLIPTVVASTALVFALFNIDNKADLTDVGLAKAKQQRRQERIRRGEYNPDANKDKDPYRYKLPFIDEDDDEDLEQINEGGGKKKVGGCG